MVVRDARPGAKLTVACDDGEGTGIVPAEAIGQAVTVGIGGAHRMLDVLTCRRVFSYAAGGARALVEGRGLIGTRRGRRGRAWRGRPEWPDGSWRRGWWRGRWRHDSGEGRLRGVAVQVAGSHGDGRSPRGHAAHRRHRIRHRDRGDGVIRRRRAIRQHTQRGPRKQAGQVHAQVAAYVYRLVADDAQGSRTLRRRANNGLRPGACALLVQRAHAHLIRLFVGQTGYRDAGIRAALHQQPLQPRLGVCRPMRRLVPAHGRLARLVRRRVPRHRQRSVARRHHHALWRPGGGFVHVRDGDTHHNRGAATAARR